MMVSFDTNVLVYATSVPLSKTKRARDLLVRGMRTGGSILLLQTLAEFSSVAIRKAGIAVDDVRKTIDAWRAVLPVQGTEDGDLSAALGGRQVRQSVRTSERSIGRRDPAAGMRVPLAIVRLLTR
jgi:predicted nucleic acid-binding protein